MAYDLFLFAFLADDLNYGSAHDHTFLFYKP
jgi:hypothetical protein